MNYVVLQEGESMFLGPNVPHAYLFGGRNTQSKPRLAPATFLFTFEFELSTKPDPKGPAGVGRWLSWSS